MVMARGVGCETYQERNVLEANGLSNIVVILAKSIQSSRRRPSRKYDNIPGSERSRGETVNCGGVYK